MYQTKKQIRQRNKVIGGWKNSKMIARYTHLPNNHLFAVSELNLTQFLHKRLTEEVLMIRK
jgi:hypothetical protein